MAFPLFARGCNPLDSKGRTDVIAYGVRVECGGVLVSPNDVVFADNDGIVVVPEEVAEEAVSAATRKVSREGQMRMALRDGMGVVEAYNRFGIL
jgi:regulator of RNase E activity RraA